MTPPKMFWPIASKIFIQLKFDLPYILPKIMHLYQGFPLSSIQNVNHTGTKLTFAEENGKSDEFKCSRPHGFKAGFPQKFSLIKVSIAAVGLCLGFGGYVKVGLILCDTIPKVPKESIIEIFCGKNYWTQIYLIYI